MVQSKRQLAVVTGASRGLGRFITMELAEAGLDIIIVGRDRQALEAVAKAAASENDSRIHSVVCDLERPDGIDTILKSVQRLGSADILINNAAIQGPIGSVWETEISAFELTMRVDFLAPVALSRALLPGMIARGAGWIVNISGGGATAARPMFSAYGSAKAALVRFTETLAAETTGKGIRVNSVAPGAFKSGMTQTIVAMGAAVGASERASAERLLETDDDSNASKTAKLIAYLVTGLGRDITGKLISTLWDDWAELHLHWNELRDSDVYTLRRIVPADRKLALGA
jgi:NAD(P)-dependent dehydrogenase (short-subunit alcohol dehydrogenase family)